MGEVTTTPAAGAQHLPWATVQYIEGVVAGPWGVRNGFMEEVRIGKVLLRGRGSRGSGALWVEGQLGHGGRRARIPHQSQMVKIKRENRSNKVNF